MAGGRPTKLDDKVTIEICKLIELGVTPPVAAECCGITRQTYYNWMERGQKSKRKSQYQEFFYKIEESKALAVKDCVLKIRDSKDWKALAWLLEHLDKFNYGTVKKLEVEHSGKIETENRYKHTIELIGTDEFREQELGVLNAISEKQEEDKS